MTYIIIVDKRTVIPRNIMNNWSCFLWHVRLHKCFSWCDCAEYPTDMSPAGGHCRVIITVLKLPYACGILNATIQLSLALFSQPQSSKGCVSVLNQVLKVGCLTRWHYLQLHRASIHGWSHMEAELAVTETMWQNVITVHVSHSQFWLLMPSPVFFICQTGNEVYTSVSLQQHGCQR